MQHDEVTLIHPDGREYTTTDPVEVNNLTSAFGYRRKEDAAPATSPAPAARPSPSPFPGPSASTAGETKA